MSRILFVCTGNVCRSPYLEFIARDALWSGGVFDVEVSSVGTRALADHALAAPLLERLADKGIDASSHRARMLTAEAVSSSQLVLTATREHRRFVAQLDPTASGRAFSLLQFARLLPEHAGGGENGLGAALTAALANRGRSGRGSQDDDLDDPWGRSSRTYRRVAQRMDEGLLPLVRFLTRPVRVSSIPPEDHSPRTA